MNNTVLQIRKDLCLGCGLCAQNCPQGAIYLLNGQASIDHIRCTLCTLCQTICPQGAIIECATISSQNLSEEIQVMRKQVEAILARIEKIGSTSSINQ